DRRRARALRAAARSRFLPLGCRDTGARARGGSPGCERHGMTPPRYTPALEMESTVPPEPVGSVSPSKHHRHGPGTSPTTAMGGRVLVLNATYEPINVCTVR